MEKLRTSVPLPFSKIVPVKPVNKEFTLTKVYVCSPGKNRNMSYIAQEELDAAAPTLSYVPVVGHLIEEKDDDGNVIGHRFGGHDCEVTEDLRLKMLTVPFGVVTTDAPEYETVMEWGKEKTYQTAYAILWTGRYPELKDAIYSEDCWFGQSMEVNFENFDILEEDSNYMSLHGLSYSALCILGKSDDPSKHVEPCFPNAHIEPVQFNLDTAQFSQTMAEMRKQLSLCFEETSSKEGGKTKLDQEKINEILANAEVAADAIDFEITDDMTEEQLIAALEDYKARMAAQPVDGDAEPGEGDQEPAEGEPTPDEGVPADGEQPGEGDFAALFSATANQKRDALRDALPAVYTYNPDGSVQSELYYWVEDFDDTHVFVERDYWTATDYDCQYGRFPYAFDEPTKKASITGEFEKMTKMWLTEAEAAQVEADRAELEMLRKFKKDAEDAAFNAQVETICSEFDDLASLEEFTAIKEKAAEFASLDELKMQLFALRGMQVKAPKKPAPAAHVRVGIDPEENPAATVEPYGGLFARYNIKPQQ